MMQASCLGFCLVKRIANNSNWPSVPYLGVDRKLSVPDEVFEKLLFTPDLGEVTDRNSDDYILFQWDQYLEKANSGYCWDNLDALIQLRSAIDPSSSQTDFLLVELVEGPDIEQWEDSCHHTMLDIHLNNIHLRRISKRRLLRSVPYTSTFLGFDIANPLLSMHSAIFQPGIATQSVNLRSELNQFGLIQSIEFALDYQVFANRQCYTPFSVLGIHLVEPAAAKTRGLKS